MATTTSKQEDKSVIGRSVAFRVSCEKEGKKIGIYVITDNALEAGLTVKDINKDLKVLSINKAHDVYFYTEPSEQ